MYEEGNILYFTPFFFKNGNPSKPKYFVVLKVVEGQTIISSLPTSKDCLPSNIINPKGCIEMPEINLNCFVFSTDEPVTVCGKCFERPTYIYGYELDSYDLKTMNENYRIEGIDYVLFGKMKPELFNSLISCLKNSKTVKKKYIRLL